jgi:hypothetical protein
VWFSFLENARNVMLVVEYVTHFAYYSNKAGSPLKLMLIIASLSVPTGEIILKF